MNKRFSKKSIPVLVGFAMVAVVVAAQADNRAPEPTPPMADTALTAAASDEQRATQFAAAGRNAISLVEAARYELSQDNIDEASAYLEQASAILDQVQRDLEFKPLAMAGGESAKDVISIYAELGVAQQADITDEVRGRLESISAYIAKGDHDKVIEGLETLGIPTVYQYVEMPVRSTLGQVQNAMQAIDAEEIEKASEELKAVTASLHSDSVRVGTVDNGQAG